MKTRLVRPLGDGGRPRACQFLYDIIILRVINSRHVKISDNNNMRFNQCGAPERPRCQVTSLKKAHAAGFLHNCAPGAVFWRVNVKERRKTRVHKKRLVEGRWREVKRLVGGPQIHGRRVLHTFRTERKRAHEA